MLKMSDYSKSALNCMCIYIFRQTVWGIKCVSIAIWQKCFIIWNLWVWKYSKISSLKLVFTFKRTEQNSICLINSVPNRVFLKGNFQNSCCSFSPRSLIVYDTQNQLQTLWANITPTKLFSRTSTLYKSDRIFLFKYQCCCQKPCCHWHVFTIFQR